jgi:hypothetical protein
MIVNFGFQLSTCHPYYINNEISKTMKTKNLIVIGTSILLLALLSLSLNLSQVGKLPSVAAAHYCLDDGPDIFNAYKYGEHACFLEHCDGQGNIIPGSGIYVGGASFCMFLHAAYCDNIYCEDIQCVPDGYRCYPWDNPTE